MADAGTLGELEDLDASERLDLFTNGESVRVHECTISALERLCDDFVVGERSCNGRGISDKVKDRDLEATYL